MRILLEDVNRPATGHASWNKLTQVVRVRFWIEKSGAKEGDELTKLVSRQCDWRREGGINTRQDRRNRSLWTLKVSINTGCDGVVIRRGADCVKVVAYCVFQSGEATVMKEGGLQRDIPQR